MKTAKYESKHSKPSAGADLTGRHSISWRARRALAVLAVLASSLGIMIAASAATTPAAHAATVQSPGSRLLDEAETRTGDWYSYGSDGPSYFDCSGLVYWSAGALGLPSWPRDTYDIAADIGTRFEVTSHPVRGDLALWGSESAPYHVEFVTAWANTTFGAQQTGTRVGWHHNTYDPPSFYLHPLY
jgi:cell wall-associated NlpC family hydrolase